MNFSELISLELKKLGYTHCFFVPGGGSMHLLNAIKKHFVCIPVVHEVAAGLAAEAFNETSTGDKSFALVTTGPGFTNIVTALAQAFVEYRPLLVLGGQVKSDDLANSGLRQRGIQELPSSKIAESITCRSQIIDKPISMQDFCNLVNLTEAPIPGPVFIEVCLDIQAENVISSPDISIISPAPSPAISDDFLSKIQASLTESERPLIIIGNNVSRHFLKEKLPQLQALGVPLMTTTSSVDRLPTDHVLNFGFGGSWGGNFYSNILISKSDLIIAIGTRLDLQFTGYNILEFLGNTKVIQIFPDKSELEKNHIPNLVGLSTDPNLFLIKFLEFTLSQNSKRDKWISYCSKVKKLAPTLLVNDSAGYVNPQSLIHQITKSASKNSIFSFASSGTASFTHALPAVHLKEGNKLNVSPGLASMGVGLSAAIGCSIANPGLTIFHFEGDGGFAQNIQELGTVSIQSLPIKIFILSNNGFASIRKTQKRYFDGSYLGCDRETGLGLPDWQKLFDAFNIESRKLSSLTYLDTEEFKVAISSSEPKAWIVDVDPELDYFPTVTTVMKDGGKMESAPLSKMTTNLSDKLLEEINKFH